MSGREGCCDDRRKPCSYHEGFADGFGQAVDNLPQIFANGRDVVVGPLHGQIVVRAFSDDVEQIIAQAITESFWRMQGGDGPSGKEPDSGDLQLAYDIVKALKR